MASTSRTNLTHYMFKKHLAEEGGGNGEGGGWRGRQGSADLVGRIMSRATIQYDIVLE